MRQIPTVRFSSAHRIPGSLVLIPVGLFCILLTGCGPKTGSTVFSEAIQPTLTASAQPIVTQDTSLSSGGNGESHKDYVFSPGDTIEVKFFYTPELNETQVVRPDGKISLQIIGEVTAAGKTPIELRGLLKRLYAPHLKQPEISVIARTFNNQKVYVGGQVMLPGVVEITGPLTALEAIMQAGGIDFREAEAKNVVVIRHKDGIRYGCLLNLEPSLEGKETQPFYLEAKDIVYVPRTEIAKVNQWIDQHINRIIPQTGFVVDIRNGNTTVGLDTSAR
jgi:protein involved in polysaccharide export with SLBB domain